MQKKLIAYCDGGLGNRLNSLIAGLHAASLLGLQPVVSWPINRWCAAAFEDLFDAPFAADRRSILEMNQENAGYLLVAHEQQAFTLPRVFNPNAALRADDLVAALTPKLQGADGLVYYNHRVPAYVGRQESDAIARTIQVKRPYREAADAYLAQAGLLGRDYWGLHLRGTDFGFSQRYFAFWYGVSRMLPGPILLCTDDPAVEAQFLRNPAIVRRPAAALPQKFEQHKGWNDAGRDEYGREFTFNIHRGEDAIREAMIDFEMLGRSRAIPTSRSTFLENAIRFSGRRPPLAPVQDALTWLRHAWRVARSADAVLQKA